jgi:magnesium transporter
MIQIFKSSSEDTPTLGLLDNIENGCWINIVAPSDEELILTSKKTGVPLDFLKAPLDDAETSRIDIEDNNIIVIVDIPFTEMEDNSLTYDTYPLAIIYTETQYLRQIDKKSLMIEKRLHKSMKNRELIQLHSLEKSLVYFSTSLKANEITLEKMLKLDMIQKYEDDKDLLEDVIIENKQAIEMTEIYSNILASTMDFFASVISNNLNIVMKVLASVTILMSIPTIMGGIYGMNVNLPFQDSPYAFPIVMLMTVGICSIVALILFKKDMFN